MSPQRDPRILAARLRPVYRGIGRLNTAIGTAVSWLTLAMVLVTALVVTLRYGFGIGSVALQESVTYLHCAVFMLGAAMTLERGGHVRVDILYRRWPLRRRALVDAAGSLLLLIPFALFTLVVSWDYVLQSWHMHEGSAEASGLPGIFLLKTLIPVMSVLLLLQGIADALRNMMILAGAETDGDAAAMSPEELI